MTSLPASPLPRLIATDLDGTLLRNDKTVSARTAAALTAAGEAGIEVLYVTGRPARWLHVVTDHVPNHSLAICANGAALVRLGDVPEHHRFLAVRDLAAPDALGVVDVLRTAAPGTNFAVERTGGLHFEPGFPQLFLDVRESIGPAEELLAPDAQATDQPVLKLLAHHPELDPDAFLTLARAVMGNRASATRSSPNTALLEIAAPDISKASTLARYCADRGITASEVVAFGDMPNDLEMLAWAGTSYAMGNAHPDVTAAATGRTTTNDEDGVAHIVEGLLARTHAHAVR